MSPLAQDPFAYRATKSGKLIVSRGGRRVSVIAGEKARRLQSRLGTATSAEEEQQLLAKATGNYRRGNERRF